MKLVEDAKDFWKWHSTHAITIAAALPIAWEQVPEDLKIYIPDELMPYVVAAVLFGGLIGRVRDQN